MYKLLLFLCVVLEDLIPSLTQIFIKVDLQSAQISLVVKVLFVLFMGR